MFDGGGRKDNDDAADSRSGDDTWCPFARELCLYASDSVFVVFVFQARNLMERISSAGSRCFFRAFGIHQKRQSIREFLGPHRRRRFEGESNRRMMMLQSLVGIGNLVILQNTRSLKMMQIIKTGG